MPSVLPLPPAPTLYSHSASLPLWAPHQSSCLPGLSHLCVHTLVFLLEMSSYLTAWWCAQVISSVKSLMSTCSPQGKAASPSLARILLYYRSSLVFLVFIASLSPLLVCKLIEGRNNAIILPLVSVQYNDSYVFSIHYMYCWNDFSKIYFCCYFWVFPFWVGLCGMSRSIRSVTVDQGLRGLYCCRKRKDTEEKC